MEEIIAHIVQPINWIDIIISVSSLFLSVVAVIISVITYRSQKEHNKNSVRPILNIVLGDYEDDLYVRVDNCGVGPAIISGTKCTCSYFDEVKSSNCLVELMPHEAVVQGKSRSSTVNMHSFSDFVEDITGRTISPGNSITLLQIETLKKDQIFAFRNFLKDCCVEIEYTDIYNSKPWKCRRLLDFFGRTLKSTTVQIRYLI